MHPKDMALCTKFPLSLHELGVPPEPGEQYGLFLSFL